MNKKSKALPPEQGPNPQGFQIGALSDLGCPHRESGVRTSIKGIKPIQVKGKKFIGVK